MVAPYMADEVKNALVAPARQSLVVVDHAISGVADGSFDTVTSPPSSELTAELDSAAQWLGVTAEEILLAALGRAVGRARGDGTAVVDVLGGRYGTCRPVALLCAAGAPMGPTEMLQGAHNGLTGASRQPDDQAEILLDLTDTAAPLQGLPAHPLEVRVTRLDGELHIRWRYDTARLHRYSVEEMAEQFPFALIEITSDAAAPL